MFGGPLSVRRLESGAIVLNRLQKQMTIKNLYLALAVIGTLVPWLFFGSFFAQHGLDIPLFAQSLFANGAAGGFSADVLIALPVFWLWSWRDAARHTVAHWWLIFPASFCVGLSLALPLYLYLREPDQRHTARHPRGLEQ